MEIWEEKIKYYNKPTQKKLIKKGTIAIDIVETTPIVWKDKLYRFEWFRKRVNDKFVFEEGFYQFVDMENGECSKPFANGYVFGSAYCENDTMYVMGTNAWGGNKIDLFISKDLVSYDKRNALTFPEGYTVYNTSLCKGKDEYIMAIEIGKPEEIAGKPFTIIFAHSKDMYNWQLFDVNRYIHTPERYSACPVIRFVDDYYYMIYLEEMPMYKFVPYIARSKDLQSFEIAPVNPVLFYSDEDRILNGNFTKEEIEQINCALNTNNSDVDLCEFDGKTIILYSWGNLMGKEFLALAEYDGTMKEFFESFF